MDNTTTILGALNAGKLPTTQQFDAFVEWVDKDVGFFAAVTEEVTGAATGVGQEIQEEAREAGKSNLILIANDVKEVLDAYRQFLNDKNADNILQEAIWHLRVSLPATAAAVGTTTAKPAKEGKDDLEKTRRAIFKLLSRLWESSTSEIRSIAKSGGTEKPLFEDLISVLRSTLADVAEAVEGRAGEVKEGLRKRQAEAEAEAMDISKEEDTTKATWESGLEEVKRVGADVIDTKRDVEGKVKDIKEGGEERVKDRLASIWERAQGDPEYKEALETLFAVWQKRLRKTLDVAADPESITLSSLFETEGRGVDDEEVEHILEAHHLLRVLFERVAGPLDPLIRKAKVAASSILGDESLKEWFDDFLTYCRGVLANVEFARSSGAQDERKELRRRWEGLMENEEWKDIVEDVQQEMRNVERKLKEDEGLKRIRDAQMNLAGNAREVVGEELMWCWRDFVRVYLPKAVKTLKSLPIPRTEYKDEDIELVLENLDISRLNIFPSHVYVRNITDVDISTASSGAERQTRLGQLTRIQIQAVQLELQDVSFWYKNLKSAVGPNEFTGLLGMKLPPRGINLDLKVRLIPAHATGKHSRESLKTFHIVERADVHIADDVEIEVKESNHPLLVGVFQPIVRKRAKEALERTLSGQVKALVEYVDGLTWDVGDRRRVFEDVGLGQGAATIAAIWSEIGKLEREAKGGPTKGEGGVQLGVKATGTGIIFQQKVETPKTVASSKGLGVPSGETMEFEEGKEVKERVLAVGVEPQVLSGEKRGPYGTGSEPIEKELPVPMDVEGAVEKGKRRLEGFRQAVARKEQLERQKEGWESNAFDF